MSNRIYHVEFKDSDGYSDGGFFCMKHIIGRIEKGYTVISKKKCVIEGMECEDCMEWILEGYREFDS